MKSVAVLAVICCLIVGETFSSPVPKVASNEGTKTGNALDLSEATGRQAVGGVAQPAAPAAASDDDDDDDDDEEDDDLDLEDLTDDDDDDDDDDEDEPKPAGAPSSDDDDDDDDEDDDYLERFIDDILGGDEDDDDDDETVSVVEPIAPAAPAQAQVVQPLVSAAPSIPAAVQSDLNALADGTGEEVGNVAENAPIEAESGSYEDDEVSDITPEGQAASSLAETGNPIEGEGIPVVLTSQSSPSGTLQQASGGTASDDDDDDDDEDDDSLDIPEITDDDEDEDDEDDDEDDEDDEDDDDDDDDDGIPDIDARRARAMDTEPPNTHVPAIYVAKYNRFVDNILGRINKILRENYDPVTVKLTNPTSSSKSKTKSSTKKKSKKSGTKKHGSKKSAFDAAAGENVNQVNKATPNVSTTQKTEADDLKNVATTVAVETLSNSVPNAVATTPRIIEPTKAQEPAESRASTNNKKQKKKRTKTKSKNKTKNTISTNTSTGDKNKTKVKKQSKPKARAILYGLSSLKRTGDVSVNMMRDHTTIKTKFGLGPLILKVEKEFGRAAKKELRSATATTAEMSGRLSLRVLHGGAATLHSIRVLQPKQVRVESADDHDRTREFVWRRSSHIAHLVSQKLSTATRSMLRPPPISVTAV